MLIKNKKIETKPTASKKTRKGTVYQLEGREAETELDLLSPLKMIIPS